MQCSPDATATAFPMFWCLDVFVLEESCCACGRHTSWCLLPWEDLHFSASSRLFPCQWVLSSNRIMFLLQMRSVSGEKGWGWDSCKIRCCVLKSTQHTQNNTQLDHLEDTLPHCYCKCTAGKSQGSVLDSMFHVTPRCLCVGEPGYSRVGVSSTETRPEDGLH
jgi:hypothetical protein